MQIFERKIVIIFLPINLNICFGCSKEPSPWDSSFECLQHMFWLRNKKITFNYSLLSDDIDLFLPFAMLIFNVKSTDFLDMTIAFD